jgi:hypothetical protein
MMSSSQHDVRNSYSMVFKDPTLKTVCLRIRWMPHGNNPQPTPEFPTFKAGETHRLIFDIFTTTLPKFGMNGLIQLCNPSSGRPLENFPLLGAGIFQTAPYLVKGRLRGFKHRCLTLVRVPDSQYELNFDQFFRLGLVINVLKKLRDEGLDSEQMYIRFVSLPFTIQQSI